MLELPHLRVSTRVGWNSVFQMADFYEEVDTTILLQLSSL